MKKKLVCWVGAADLKGAKLDDRAAGGPINKVLLDRTYDEVVLLNNYPQDKGERYRGWIAERVDCPVLIHHVSLTSPTDFGEIYKESTFVVDGLIAKADIPPHLTFHLSPGTPAMAAVWVILGKTKYDAELIESSIKQGVKTVSFPFDISADFRPDMVFDADSRLVQLVAGLPPTAPEFKNILHRCESMKRVVAKARRIALRSVPVLIEGESGTGKELIARAIHKASSRGERELVVVNCGAIPSELVESSLFGHKKGAFTGAVEKKVGSFEAADKSSIFLDEIGELPLAAQVKLLRTLQEGEVPIVGETKPKKVDVRIIAATNRNLSEEVGAGRFRSDLFYRLAVAVLSLPPLREREGDIGLLIDKFMEQVNLESKGEPGYSDKKVSVSAKKIMQKHPWPGNVRELQNTIRRAAVWTMGDIIHERDMEEAFFGIKTSKDNEIMCRSFGGDFSIQETLDEVRELYLRRALSESSGNKTHAAKILGLSSYQTLQNWLDKLGLDG